MSGIGGPPGSPVGPRLPLVDGGNGRTTATPDGSSGAVKDLGRAMQGATPESLRSLPIGRLADFSIGLGPGGRTPPPDGGLAKGVAGFKAGLPGDLGALAGKAGETRQDRQAGIALERAVDQGVVRLRPDDPEGSMQSVRAFAQTLPEGMRADVIARALAQLKG